MITAFGLLGAGLYMWRHPGTILRCFAILALFCADLALLSIVGAL